jgi:uncharacterized heparinase superfamily protein
MTLASRAHSSVSHHREPHGAATAAHGQDAVAPATLEASGSSAVVARAQPGGVWRLRRFWRTVRHIPPMQLAARSRSVAWHQLYGTAPRWPIARAARRAAGAGAAAPLPALPFDLVAPEGMHRVQQRADDCARGRFTYVGRTVELSLDDWRRGHVSPLWTFHLHYLGCVSDLALTGQMAAAHALLASWASVYAKVWDPVAWHPYPVSQRLINLCIAAEHAGGFAGLGDTTLQLAATHAAYLLSHLEHDLRGNHLLENACALLFAARHLQGGLATACEQAARALLTVEVPEQVLADGAHFELSPMYHALALRRVLQVIALLGPRDSLVRNLLAPAASRMLYFLRGICCPDGELPLLGDSVRDYAPPPAALLAAGAHLGIPACESTTPDGVLAFADSGLHVLRSSRLWAIFDAGPTCPASLPGHGQADSLTIEVWCGGACVVADPGVYDYTGPERAWGRASRTHSTITVDDTDTSEVYGSFRVGGRAQVVAVRADESTVEATVVPFGQSAELTRQLRLRPHPERLEVVDTACIPAGRVARSRLHLHPQAVFVSYASPAKTSVIIRTAAGTVHIRARHPIAIETAHASRQFGTIEPTIMLVQTLGTRLDPPSLGGTFTIEPLD